MTRFDELRSDLEFWRAHGTPSDCVEWAGARITGGYGNVWREGRMHRVHRLAFALWSGTHLDASVEVMHSCDNPPCYNSRHLSTGTHRENIQDASQKRRLKGNPSKGESNNASKLDEVSVGAIRSLAADGVSQLELAVIYGVSRRTINYVINRKVWAHVQ